MCLVMPIFGGGIAVRVRVDAALSSPGKNKNWREQKKSSNSTGRMTDQIRTKRPSPSPNPPPFNSPQKHRRRPPLGITKCSIATGSRATIPPWGPTLYPWVGPQSGIFYIAAHLIAHLATVVHFRRRRPWHPPPVTHNSHYFLPDPSDLSNAVTQGTPQRRIRHAAACGTGCVVRVSKTKPLRSVIEKKKHHIVARANGGE